MKEEQAYIVAITGGCGFVGSHICKLALQGFIQEMKIKELRVIDLKTPEHSGVLSNALLSESRDDRVKFTFKMGSILDHSLLIETFSGANLLIHCAGLIDWGNNPASKLLEVNLNGTQNVIAAALECDIQRIVYTSTLDTIMTWKPCINTPHDVSYPKSPTDFAGGYYGYSKSLAEREILQANSKRTKSGLPVEACALRPRGIYGEDDPVYLPSFLRALHNGSMVVKIGHPSVQVDQMYVGNVAYAHWITLAQMLNGKTEIAGTAYNLSYEKPMNTFAFVEIFASKLGYQMPRLWVPYPIMSRIARFVDFVLSLFPKSIRPVNLLTPSSVAQIALTRTFDGTRFRQDCNFEPLFSKQESYERTAAWLKNVWERQEILKENKKTDSIAAQKRFFAAFMLVLLLLYFNCIQSSIES